MPAYIGAKEGLRALTRALAVEVGASGILVNAIARVTLPQNSIRLSSKIRNFLTGSFQKHHLDGGGKHCMNLGEDCLSDV